jgi:hypothetical protein
MIGVLTTGPRLQNACNDTFLQPNYYTYSNSDHGCVLDVTSQALCKLGHLVTSQYPNLNTPGVQGEPLITWVVPEGFEHWIVRHCDDIIISVSVTSSLIPL